MLQKKIYLNKGPSLHGGSLEIKLKVPLTQQKPSVGKYLFKKHSGLNILQESTF